MLFSSRLACSPCIKNVWFIALLCVIKASEVTSVRGSVASRSRGKDFLPPYFHGKTWRRRQKAKSYLWNGGSRQVLQFLISLLWSKVAFPGFPRHVMCFIKVILHHTRYASAQGWGEKGTGRVEQGWKLNEWAKDSLSRKTITLPLAQKVPSAPPTVFVHAQVHEQKEEFFSWKSTSWEWPIHKTSLNCVR